MDRPSSFIRGVPWTGLSAGSLSRELIERAAASQSSEPTDRHQIYQAQTRLDGSVLDRVVSKKACRDIRL